MVNVVAGLGEIAEIVAKFVCPHAPLALFAEIAEKTIEKRLKSWKMAERVEWLFELKTQGFQGFFLLRFDPDRLHGVQEVAGSNPVAPMYIS
jgi:hypothetical protein